MLADATQGKANIFLCPTKNQAAGGVRYGLTFSTRDDSMLNEGQRGQRVTKERGTYSMFSTTLSTPLTWQYLISRDTRTKHLLGEILICT